MDDMMNAIREVQSADPMIYPRLLEQHREEAREAELDDWLTMWHVAERAQAGKTICKVHDADTGRTMVQASAEDDDHMTALDWARLAFTLLVTVGIILWMMS